MKYILANDGKLSGRASGNVYMRNGVVRAMAFFAPVRNSFTLAVRSGFASFSSLFRGLTQLQIIAWNAFYYDKSDVFAQKIKVTGKQAYIGLNMNIRQVSGTAIDDAPLGAVAPSATFDVVLTTLSPIHVLIGFSLNPDGGTTIVRATRPLSAATLKPQKNDFRIIGVIDTTAIGTNELISKYSAKFGAPVSGSKIFLTLQSIDSSTGLPSQQSGTEGITV